MRGENIRFRVFLPLALAGVLLLAVFVGGVFLRTRDQISHNLDHEVEELTKAYQMVIDQDADSMKALLSMFAQAPALAEHFLAGDREVLNNWLRPRHETLRSIHQITHFYVFDRDRRCFFRAHQPARFGDVIGRKTLLEAQATGKPFSGLELGPLGTLTLRTVLPWYHDGKLLGYLEAGKEIGPIADRLAATLGIDLVITLRKRFLKREDWESGMKMLGHQGSWEQFPSWVRIYPEAREIPIVLSEVLAGVVDENFPHRHFSVSRNHRQYEVVIEPVADAEGREVGGRVLLYDVTSAVSESRKFVALIGSATFVVAGMLLALLYVYLGRLENSLKTAHRRALEESEAREQSQLQHLAELRRAREGLERQVAERTAELTATNEMLRREIAERRLAEDAIRSSEEKYRTLFEESKDPIIISTPAGLLLDANPAAVELFGYPSQEEFLQATMGEFYADPGEPEKFQDLMEQQGFVKNHGLNMKTRDGRELQVVESATAVRDARGQITAYRRTMRDNTELKRYEKQFIQAQKMESIGTLAGGLAHDFNNILGGILCYATLMKQKLPRDHPYFSYVETIEKGTSRAAGLTAQLLAFSRGGKFEIRPTDVNEIILETQKLLERTFDKAIQIRVNLQQPLPAVEGDAGQMHQVLMNLCVNARDAMPSGGILSITSGTEQVGEEYLSKYNYARSGAFVVISVSDTGTGMDRETMERIFEPFFTTKEQGKGTGLGLAMVYGVVKNHGGWVNVYSEPGFGTIFKVYLPASGAVPAEAKIEAAPAAVLGNELILVVDDEEIIRVMLKETLESFNCRVLLAHNGTQAVKIYTEYKDEIDLVILDMIMPIMGGEETFRQLKAINPGVRVLLTTGYSQDGQAQAIIESGVRGFIQKPYRVEDLLRSVNAALRNGKPG